MSTKIALWSGPRNVSTALMYSFAQHPLVQVWDEPLFGHFLAHTGVWRPSRDEVLETMECDANEVWKKIEAENKLPFAFLKNMANHLEGLNSKKLKECRNIVLLRQPSAVIASYVKQIEKPSLLDLCYPQQLRIIEYCQSKDLPYLVVDSDEILKNPQTQLQKMCEFAGLPFNNAMLQWPAGARPEDGVWAKYWYHNVHQSTGFGAYQTKTRSVPSHLVSLLAESDEFYQKIKKHLL